MSARIGQQQLTSWINESVGKSKPVVSFVFRAHHGVAACVLYSRLPVANASSSKGNPTNHLKVIGLYQAFLVVHMIDES